MQHSPSVFQATPKFHQIKPSLRPHFVQSAVKLDAFWTLTRKFIGTFTRLTLIALRSASTSLSFRWVSLTLLSELAPERKGMKIHIILHLLILYDIMNSPAWAWVRVFAGSFKCLWKSQVRSPVLLQEVLSYSHAPIHCTHWITLLYVSVLRARYVGFPGSTSSALAMYLRCMKSAPTDSSDNGQVGLVSFWIAWRTQGPGPFHANMHEVLPSWQNTPGSTQHHCWQLY